MTNWLSVVAGTVMLAGAGASGRRRTKSVEFGTADLDQFAALDQRLSLAPVQRSLSIKRASHGARLSRVRALIALYVLQ